jgi:hypothetical protein
MVDFVEQPPIGLQMTIAVVLPFSGQRMVFVARWERGAFGQEQDQLAQL